MENFLTKYYIHFVFYIYSYFRRFDNDYYICVLFISHTDWYRRLFFLMEQMPHMAEFSAIQQQIYPYLLKIHSKTDIYHRLLLPLRTTENKDKYYFIENNNYAV